MSDVEMTTGPVFPAQTYHVIRIVRPFRPHMLRVDMVDLNVAVGRPAPCAGRYNDTPTGGRTYLASPTQYRGAQQDGAYQSNFLHGITPMLLTAAPMAVPSASPSTEPL